MTTGVRGSTGTPPPGASPVSDVTHETLRHLRHRGHLVTATIAGSEDPTSNGQDIDAVPGPDVGGGFSLREERINDEHRAPVTRRDDRGI